MLTMLQGATTGEAVGWLIIGVLALAVYLVPTIVAYRRNHAYRHVILGINVVGGVFIVGWLGAFIWAVWPNEKSLADPILGNVTGKGQRNAGDTLGAATYGVERGYEAEKRLTQEGEAKSN